jgi:hypothetical protein
MLKMEIPTMLDTSKVALGLTGSATEHAESRPNGSAPSAPSAGAHAKLGLPGSATDPSSKGDSDLDLGLGGNSTLEGRSDGERSEKCLRSCILCILKS